MPPPDLIPGPEVAEAVIATIMEAHDEAGQEMDDIDREIVAGIEREAARSPLEAIQEDVDREILDSMQEDADHMEREIHVGLGLPDPGPNANGDVFTPEARQALAARAHEHIRRELRGIQVPPAIRTTRPPQGMPMVVGPESSGIEPVFTETHIRRVGRRSGMSVSAAVIEAVEQSARQSTQRFMEAIRQGQVEGVSMGCQVPHNPASDPPRPDQLYFTARERIGVGVVNPRGLAQLGLTGGGEHLGTFSDPHPAEIYTETPTREALERIRLPERRAEAGLPGPRYMEPSYVQQPASRVHADRVRVPEFEIHSNPTMRLDDIRTRRFDRHEPRQPLPFEIDAWVMARGLIMQVEEADHEKLLCRVWNPVIKRFERDILLTIEVKEAAKCPEPPARTAWDWLMAD